MELARNAPGVIARHFPEVAAIYERAGWVLPERIERVYDPAKAELLLGWRAQTDFAAVLAALKAGAPLPFAHDPDWVSPVLAASR